jgi:hypothetical protein
MKIRSEWQDDLDRNPYRSDVSFPARSRPREESAFEVDRTNIPSLLGSRQIVHSCNNIISLTSVADATLIFTATAGSYNQMTRRSSK